MNNRESLILLQEQSAFKIGVDVKKGEKITGGFGKTLYKAKWIDREESPVVLIEIKGNNISEEVYLYISLDHPHIIKTYGLVDPNGYTTDSNSVLLLQEYAEDGDLGSMLFTKHFVPQQNVLLEIFIQVANAMIFLSNNGIIHGDLSCRNVVVFKSHPYDPKKNLVKLIDFGLTQNNSKSSYTKIEIPVRYVAQEILRNKGRSGYSEKSDVYSFAVFMWEACSFGKIPYEDINEDDEVSREKLQGKRLTQPDKCDPNIWKLMNLCWNDRPENRPTFQMIHTQLKNIQNVEYPSPLSNSILSASSKIEDTSCLFQIEYQTCHDCNLRYTDYDSHRNNCSKTELTCFKCGNQYRRATYYNHVENCNDLFDTTIPIPPSTDATPHKDRLDQDTNLNRRGNSRIPFPSKSNNQFSSLFNLNQNDSSQLSSNNNRSRFDSSPQSNQNTQSFQKSRYRSSEKSISPEPIPRRRTTVQKNPSQLNTIQLPCEICNQLIDESQYKIHQRECDRKDRERLEAQRRKIEQQETTEQVECSYCSRKYSIKRLDEHQNTCSSNPVNVPDQLSVLSEKLSISVPDFGHRNFFSEISTSSNESIKLSQNDHQSKSTTDLKIPKPVSLPTIYVTSMSI